MSGVETQRQPRTILLVHLHKYEMISFFRVPVAKSELFRAELLRAMASGVKHSLSPEQGHQNSLLKTT
jgi:hypothetical protein